MYINVYIISLLLKGFTAQSPISSGKKKEIKEKDQSNTTNMFQKKFLLQISYNQPFIGLLLCQTVMCECISVSLSFYVPYIIFVFMSVTQDKFWILSF